MVHSPNEYEAELLAALALIRRIKQGLYYWFLGTGSVDPEPRVCIR